MRSRRLFYMALMRGGDFNADSDIDIMILVNASDEEIIEKKLAISDMTYDVNDLHDMEIMPIVKNAEHFF